MSGYRQRLGKWGEDQACSYLFKNGYKILQRNYRCRFGEIDIVACKADELVFVEVKTRTSNAYGYPAEAVSYRKQLKYDKLAMCFLKETGRKNISCRFDILEIMVNRDNTFSINLIQNAFLERSGYFY